MWPSIVPSTPLKWSWHLDVICDHLEAVSRGDIKRLLINIPPRHLKSTLVSVCFPAWEWLRRPHLKYLTASHKLSLALRDAVYSRRVLLTDRYQALIQRENGEALFRLQGDQNVKGRYENDAGGHRISTSVGAGTTGEGGNRIIIDDAHDASQVQSDVEREAVLEWWDQTMSTRLNDPEKDAVIGIMQRVHEQDLSGHWIKQGGWDHVCLPTLYEPEHPIKSVTSLGFSDPRTEPGEMLFPDHFGEAAIAGAQKALGSHGFAGQHQQRPAPKGGAVFRHGDFRRFRLPPTTFDQVLGSWDCAVKGKAAEEDAIKGRSYVVGQVWGFLGGKTYLLEERRGQWDIGRTMEEILEQREQWGLRRILIEDKANGPAIMQMLKGRVPGLIEATPKGSKIQRALGCQTFVESGSVYIPDPQVMPWAAGFLDEVTTFPYGQNDDRVDAMTQALLDVWADDRTAAVRRFLERTKL